MSSQMRSLIVKVPCKFNTNITNVTTMLITLSRLKFLLLAVWSVFGKHQWLLDTVTTVTICQYCEVKKETHKVDSILSL